MLTVVIAVLVFGLLVFVHETGHLIAAKSFKIHVQEFAFGMGPKLLKKKIGDTLFSLRLIPVGGFCMMEDGEEEIASERSFSKKPAWKRAVVLFAGSFMNILLGFIISVLLFAADTNMYSTVVDTFANSALSSGSGLMEGDRILELNGSAVNIALDFGMLLAMADEPISLTVERGSERVVLESVSFPKVIEGEEAMLARDFYFRETAKTFFEVIKQGVLRVFSFTRFVWQSLIMLLSGGASPADLAGPVGTTAAIGSAVREGFSVLLVFVMFISINLGVVNLLPFPALDGGRLVFLLAEKLIGRPVSKKVEGAVNFAGFALLMALMAFVTLNDISRFFR